MAEVTVFEIAINIAVIVIALVILDYASNLTINNAIKVAEITRLGKTAVGFSLIAFSTSLPELTVAVTAVLAGGAALSIGNVLGSNIFNVCVVVGLAGTLCYYLHIRHRKRHPREQKPHCANIVFSIEKSELSSIYFGLFVSSVIPLVLIFITEATWIVGLVLVGIFIGYMYQLSKVRIQPEIGEKITTHERHNLKRFIMLTVVGALGVVGSAYFLVESAVVLAEAAGLSEQVIGATVIAFGTSLPELTLDLKSILRGHPGLAFGDIVGSSFINITLILGVTLLLPAVLGSPIVLSIEVFRNIVLFSIIANLVFWYFLSKGQIGYKESLMLLFIYVLFVVTTAGALI
jgi:cation:H+ antiporter